MAKLTQNEITILELASKGYNNEQIADKLYISPHTVKSYIAKFAKQYNSTNLTTIYKIIKNIMH